MKYFWWSLIIVVGAPVLAYLVMKFGTAGYLRAKFRARENNKENE